MADLMKNRFSTVRRYAALAKRPKYFLSASLLVGFFLYLAVNIAEISRGTANQTYVFAYMLLSVSSLYLVNSFYRWYHGRKALTLDELEFVAIMDWNEAGCEALFAALARQKTLTAADLWEVCYAQHQCMERQLAQQRLSREKDRIQAEAELRAKFAAQLQARGSAS